MKLFESGKITNDSKRAHYRIMAELEADMQVGSAKMPVLITDISLGGARVESYNELESDKAMLISFAIQNQRISALCRIVHIIEETSIPHIYGIKFETIWEADVDKINTFIFSRQAILRRRRHALAEG